MAYHLNEFLGFNTGSFKPKSIEAFAEIRLIVGMEFAG